MGLKKMIEKMPGYNQLVRPLHYAQALKAGMKYKWPAKKLRVIGVTGTNGKTTTSFMIWKMLTEAGCKVGLLTTVGWGGVSGSSSSRSALSSSAENNLCSRALSRKNKQASSSLDSYDCSARGNSMTNMARSDVPDASDSAHSKQDLGDSDGNLDATILHRQYEHMTTERVEILNQRMRAIADAGAEFLVLEVTSHALMQFRTLGVPIEIAVFANLTHEHLDYHKTFEKYRKAKLKLFKKAKSGVVNADDGSASIFEKAVCVSSRRIADNGQTSASEDAMLAADFSEKNPSAGRFLGSESKLSLRSETTVGRGRSNTACSDAPDASDSTRSKRSEGAANDEINSYGDIITYGIEHGEVRATEVELSADGVSYSCGDMKIKTRIPGEFNVYNSLAAVCVGKKLGLTNKEIERGIYALESVEGRMNRVDEGQSYTVIVDYAHTPDALEKALSSVIADSSSSRSTSLSSPVRGSSMPNTAPLRASNSPRISSKNTSSPDRAERGDIVSGRRVISVHGGAGRRDESTRSMRGEILGKYSDIVIITEDDSRDEDPEAIAAQFVEGAEKAGKVEGKNLFVELDRRAAIRKALEEAREGDIVLVLGKGHEKTILRADGPHEFEDVKVVRELLKELKK